MTPEEEKAAQTALDEAIETFVRTMKWNGDEETGPLIMTSWVLIGHQAGWGMDDDGSSGYILAYKGGTQPDHIVLGLFSKAMDLVRGVGRHTRDRRETDDTDE